MDFYDFISKYYDRWALGDPACRVSKDFYQKLYLNTQGIIIEAGIGTGRIALDLARNNRPIIGIDISECMLSICNEKVKTYGLSDKLKLIQMDLRQLGLRNIDLITLPFRTIGHFTTYDQRQKVFNEILNALKPGGLFVFDHYIADSAWAEANNGVPHLMYRCDSVEEGRVFVWDTYKYDFDANLMDCIVTIEDTAVDGFVSGRRHLTFPFSWLDPKEITQLANEVGFTIKQVYGDFHENHLKPNSDNQIWILQKPKT